jgi:DNA-binding GntR family transcriptional regulator
MKNTESGPDLTDGAGRLERSTTANDVADILRKRILVGGYSENEFIRQESIASELGVSRIPVREALAQLESEGLVQRLKYRGAVVAKLSTQEITEIYELRAMLEPHLLKYAIRNISAAELAELRAIIDRSRKLTSLAEWAGLNVEFHVKLLSAARQPLALQVLENLLVRADRYLKLQKFHSWSAKEKSDDEHERLLELVESGDEASAVAALRTHIGETASDVPLALGLAIK